jgi:ketosteroid isomerase-like protein
VSAHVSPADLYRHGLRLLLDKDVPGWVGPWADDGVMEFPFAPEGRPERLAGKEAVAAYMRHHPDHIAPLAVLRPGADFAGSSR